MCVYVYIYILLQLKNIHFASGILLISMGKLRVDGQSDWTGNGPITAEPEGWRKNVAQTQRSTVSGQFDAKSGRDHHRL